MHSKWYGIGVIFSNDNLELLKASNLVEVGHKIEKQKCLTNVCKRATDTKEA